jgi:hypothetical protein
MGKDGIVATIKVSTTKAPMAENSNTWNRKVRYFRFGSEVVSAFAASLIFLTESCLTFVLPIK